MQNAKYYTNHDVKEAFRLIYQSKSHLAP